MDHTTNLVRRIRENMGASATASARRKREAERLPSRRSQPEIEPDIHDDEALDLGSL
jgi:hypothetical protein